MNVDKVKQVPLSHREIILLLQLISKSVPEREDQEAVVNLVNKLEFILRLQ